MRSLSDPHLRVLNTGGRAVQIVAVDLYLLRHDLSRYPLPRSWRYERLHLPWQHANLMGYPVKDMHQRLSFPFTIEPGFAFAFCAEGEHGYEAMRDLLRGTRKLLPGVELADGRVVFGRRWSAGG